jgi:hypothetical protein
MAGKRARTAGQLLRLGEKLAAIQQRLAQARQHVAALEQEAEAVRRVQDELQRTVGALDASMHEVDRGARPERIAPVFGWREVHARGALTEGTLRILREAGGMPISTTCIAERLAALVGVDVSHPEERKRWREHSVRPTLTYLRKRGQVDRELRRNPTHGQLEGHWRLTHAGPSPEDFDREVQARGWKTRCAREAA